MERQRILLVDDFRPIREGLAHYLTQRGHDVACAGSVEEARHRIAQGFSPDLVITDWRLGGREDGVDLVRQIQRFKPDVRAFMISAHPSDRVRRALGKLRINGILSKPFSLNQVSQVCHV